MKTNIKKRFTTMLLTGALAISVPHWASAAGTVACTVVSNNATVSYSVDGTSQPDETDPTPAVFTVGNKVIVTVATSNIAPGVTVVPGKSTAQLIAAQKVLTFTVTNGGNARQDYVLTPTAKGTNTADPFGNADDSFDLTGVTVFVESGGGAGYQQASDLATTIDDLDPGTITVYIVPNGAANTIPAGLADGSTSVYSLLATTYKANGAIEAEGNDAVTSTVGSCTADIVFADTTPGTDDDLVNPDGKGSDRSTYSVCTANIAVSKTSVVYSDPINLLVSPKAIPGAVVRYTISLGNTGCTSATLTTITDVLATELQIVSANGGASWSVTGSGRGVATASGTLTADSPDGGDGLGHDTGAPGGTLTATLTTILAADAPNSYTAGELKPGETVNIVFDVTLQ